MTVRVKGTVLDERGYGVPWVSISNGETVVSANGRGRYEIEAEQGSHSFITLSVPDTHRAVGGFYHRVPEADSEIDFELRAAPERQYGEFTLAQITDTHVRTEPYYRPQGAWLGPETGPRLTGDLQQLERESSPDLVLATGDLTDIGTMAELEHFRNAIAPIRTPIRPVYGGHDGHVELEAQGGNRDKYEYVEGVSCIQNYQGVLGPVYYSFDWGGRHFVAFSKEDSYFTQADIARKDRWLIEDLSALPDGRETVLYMHTPPAIEFLDLLGQYNVRLVLFGHTHCAKAFEYKGMAVGGPTPLCFGGYDGNSRGYRLVRFTENGFEFDLVQQTTTARSNVKPTRVFLGGQGKELDLLWSHALPGPTHRAAPALHGDQLLYSVTDDNLRGHAGVYAVDSKSGRRDWHVPTDTSVKNTIALSEEGVAVATSVAGRVHGIDARSGELAWSRDLPRYPGRWIYTSPVIADGTVYTGGKAGYGAYVVATGEERWYTTLTTPVGSGDPVGDGWGSFPSPLVVGGLLITHLSGRGIVALDRANGEIAWENPLGITHYFSSPVLADGLIIGGVEFGKLAALDPETGETVWEGEVLDAQYPTHVLVDGDRMYVSTNQGRVRSLGLTPREAFWSVQAGSDLLDMNPFRRGARSMWAAPVKYGSLLAVGGIDGGLYIVDSETGGEVSRTEFPAPISAAPGMIEGRLIVATWDGRLWGFGDGAG